MKKNQYGLTLDDVRISFLIHNYPNIATKDLIEKEYILNKKSLPEIKKEYGLNYELITFLIEYYGFKRRSVKESTGLKNTRDKYKKTCLEKYGAENALSKGTKSYLKRNKTVQEKYGVNNVFQIEEIKARITPIMLERYGVKRCTNGDKVSETKLSFSEEKKNDIKNKTIETNLGRYGYEYSSKTEESRRNHSEKIKRYYEGLTQDQRLKIRGKFKERWKRSI